MQEVAVIDVLSEVNIVDALAQCLQLLQRHKFHREASLLTKVEIMIKLKSLQGQLENLQIILEETVSTGKSDEEIKKIKNQIIEVQRLIAERIIFLNEHPN